MKFPALQGLLIKVSLEHNDLSVAPLLVHHVGLFHYNTQSTRILTTDVALASPAGRTVYPQMWLSWQILEAEIERCLC